MHSYTTRPDVESSSHLDLLRKFLGKQGVVPSNYSSYLGGEWLRDLDALLEKAQLEAAMKRETSALAKASAHSAERRKLVDRLQDLVRDAEANGLTSVLDAFDDFFEDGTLEDPRTDLYEGTITQTLVYRVKVSAPRRLTISDVEDSLAAENPDDLCDDYELGDDAVVTSIKDVSDTDVSVRLRLAN